MTSLEPLYRGWSLVEQQLEEFLMQASDEQLGWRTSRDQWPVWALVAHLAGARVYWLCSVAGQPGFETTPFANPAREGWEDDLDHARRSQELLEALKSSWAIVDRCLQTWSPETLQDEVVRQRFGNPQVQTRQLILMRLLTHDSFHSGEVSQVLGAHGLDALDPWLRMHKNDA